MDGEEILRWKSFELPTFWKLLLLPPYELSVDVESVQVLDLGTLTTRGAAGYVNFSPRG